MYLFSPFSWIFFPPSTVNPFAPGWEEVCHKVPYDCEDVTNRRVRQVLCQSPRVFSASLTPTSALAPADRTDVIHLYPHFVGLIL